jgi:deoxyribose-phosphate aldolase
MIADLLRGCDVKTCAVIDFPGGASSSLERAQQADRAVAEGADELDVVMNYRAMLAGDFKGVRDDLVRVVRAVRGRAANDARGDVLVKVIIEAPLLNDKVKRLACKIVVDSGADFAKTCTGVGTAATIHDVELMRDALPEGVGVTAAGGVTTLEGVQAMIGAGAARVSTPTAQSVLAELAKLNGNA